MAITQISKVKVRRGPKDELPQLEGGEFGWCVDTHELFIGVGTDAEAANPGTLVKVITQPDVTSGNANVIINYNSNLVTVTDSLGAGQTGASITVSAVPVAFTITEPSVVLNYSIKRDSDFKTGRLLIAHNGTTVNTLDHYVQSSDIGVNLSATMSGTSALLTFTSSAGNPADMKYTKSDFTW